MNELLKEIAVKAQVEHCVSHVRLNEFAELIVRECCQKLENDGMVEIAIELKQHFGFE
jgi:hypothetical protein